MRWLHWPLIVLCLIECTLVWRRSHGNEPMSSEKRLVQRLLATLVLYYLILHMVGAPYPRYNIPLLPFIFGLAMVPLLAAFGAVRRLGYQPNGS